MDRCPACRARLKGQAQCYRCGSDLSLALQAEAEANQWTQRAARYFSEGAFDDADAALDRALMLHQTPLALSLRPFFRQCRAVGPWSAPKPGSLLLSRIAESALEPKEAHPVLPVAAVPRQLGRALLRPLARPGVLDRRQLRTEPDGLVVWLADACSSRSATAKLALQAGKIVKTLTGAVKSRLAPHEAKRPESTASDSLAPLKDAIGAAAIEVHHTLGPGLPASVYEACLCSELQRNGIPFKREVPIAVNYKAVQLDSGYRMNLLLADKLIVMIEGADAAGAVERHRLLNYLCAGGWTAGVVINFNVAGSTASHLEDS